MKHAIFSKKEPIQPKEVSAADILAKVYELYPDRKYVFWFERMISPTYVQHIRGALERFLPNQVTMIAGVETPQIYEFEGDENGPVMPTDPDPGEKGQPRGSDPNTSR
jgi:hypothetical protein